MCYPLGISLQPIMLPSISWQADRHRLKTGKGQKIKLALSDVALSSISNLGFIGDVIINNSKRERIGNFLYGAWKKFITKRQHTCDDCSNNPKTMEATQIQYRLSKRIKKLEKRIRFKFFN